jgi:vitamin B12 transporter
LIDGVRLASQSVGATSLEAIPLEQIERIEILRGPASSLYGSDAIGGVIQVFTRRGTGELSGSASAGYGTYDTWSAAAGIGGSVGPVRVSVQLGAKGSAGFDAIVDKRNFSANDDRDGYRGDNASVNATLPWAAGQELSAQYFVSRLNAQYDGGPDHDDRTITTLSSWQVASRNALTEYWVSRLSAGAGIDDSVSETGYGDFPFRTVQSQYAWQNDFALPRSTLTLGVERREESVTTDADFAVTSRTTDSAFAIYRLRYAAHALQANLRVDHASQYGNHTTGAIAYGYTPGPGWRFTAAYGTAFKAPSFNDLYYPMFSNPNLVPETSRNAEAGIHWSGGGDDAAGGRWQARAIAYRNVVDDLIVFQCDADFNCAPQNADRARLQGATLGVDATIAATTLTASLDLQSPMNTTTDKLLPRRARQHGAVTISRQLGPVRVGAELIASSYRYDDAANLVRMAGYGILNLTAEWALARQWALQVRANNVLDRNYELAAGYSTGGATVFAGLRWQP